MTKPRAAQGTGGNTLSINSHHLSWIKDFQSRYATTTALCSMACHEGIVRFPDLRLVRGLINLSGLLLTADELLDIELFVDGIPGNLSPHWWLETQSGEIVDATAAQFTDPAGCYRVRAVQGYIPFPEHLADCLPTGKCPNCGGYCYAGRSFCTDECEHAYAAYVTRESTRSCLNGGNDLNA